MWALNIVRNNNGDEQTEVKDMSNDENTNTETREEVVNEESTETQNELVVNHYKRHWGKYVCGVVLLGGGYLFYRSR